MKVRTKLIGTLAVGAALLAPVAQAQSPDDRPGPRGPAAVAEQATVADAADRTGAREPGGLGARESSAAVHPDDRPGPRGLGVVSANLAQPDSTGFDWGDALIGGLGGAGIALLLTGCAFLLLSQRTKARTA